VVYDVPSWPFQSYPLMSDVFIADEEVPPVYTFVYTRLSPKRLLPNCTTRPNSSQRRSFRVFKNCRTTRDPSMGHDEPYGQRHSKKQSCDTCEDTGAPHDLVGSKRMNGLDYFFDGLYWRLLFYLNIPMFYPLLSLFQERPSCSFQTLLNVLRQGRQVPSLRSSKFRESIIFPQIPTAKFVGDISQNAEKNECSFKVSPLKNLHELANVPIIDLVLDQRTLHRFRA
jgi:hypothetical protein